MGAGKLLTFLRSEWRRAWLLCQFGRLVPAAIAHLAVNPPSAHYNWAREKQIPIIIISLGTRSCLSLPHRKLEKIKRQLAALKPEKQA